MSGSAEASASGRMLQWDGCFNVRDLGGLPLRDGRTTRFGAVVRGDDPCKLSAAGWAALERHGIRTVVSLQSIGAARNDPDLSLRPAGLTTVNVDVEDFGDREFMDSFEASHEPEVWSTPLYYEAALARWPQRSADAIRAIARADAGGVFVHCGVGRDRTGLVALLLLSLCGATHDAIVADYETTYASMGAVGNAAEADAIHARVARAGTSPTAIIRRILGEMDVEAFLRDGGLEAVDREAARTRLV